MSRLAKNITMDMSGEGKCGSKVNEMGEVPFPNRDRHIFSR